MESTPHILITLRSGKADNGKNATLAFSCGLSALAMGHPATIFLTSDGSVWGFEGTALGIVAQGFPPLSDLIQQYLDGGGEIVLCSVCHKTCSIGSPESNPTVKTLPQVTIGGFAMIIERSVGGLSMTF